MAVDVEASAGEPASFVGRETEIRALAMALDRVRAGRGRLVAITGDAGIGKTRLVEELVESFALPAGRALWGRCLEQTGAPTYWPWIRILRGCATARGLDGLREDLGPEAPLLAPLLPGLLPSGDAPRPTRRGDGEDRYHLFAAVTGLLRRVAASEPLVLVLEDVHWADEASLALLEFVAQEVDDSPVLVIVTFRERERARLPRPLVDAVRRGQRIALQGLDRDAVGAIVSRVAGAPASPVLVDRLVEVTAGNPFFLSEVLRTLAQEGRLDPSSSPTGPLTLPDTVRDSIRRHLDPLASEDREVLALAAVAGGELDLGLLKLASGADAAVVLQRLHDALERGLLVEQAGGRLRFAHALVRETIYADLPAATRIRLHAQVGDALEQLHGSDDAAPLGELASHFLHAAPLGTAAKAAGYAARAGRRAMSMYAFHDALSAYEQALAALGVDGTDRKQRMSLRLAAAEAARRAGLDTRAQELFHQASQDAHSLGDGTAIFRAAVGTMQSTAGPLRSHSDEVRMLQDALRFVPEGDSAERATLLALLAVARYYGEGGVRDLEVSTAGVEMARRVGNPGALSAALLSHQIMFIGAGRTDRRLALSEEAITLAEGGMRDIEPAARASRIACLLERGDVSLAAAEVERMTRVSARLRRPASQWHAIVFQAAIALLEGRFDDGSRLAAEALAARRNATDRLAPQVFVLQMFLARRDTGQHGGLEGSIRRMVEQHPESWTWRCVLPIFLADLGRDVETRPLFEELAVDGFRRVPQHTDHPAILAWLARLCSFFQDKARSEQLYPLLLPYAEQNIVLSHGGACLGSAHRYLGLLAGALEQWDLAEKHFQGSLAMNERMGARPVLACCEHEYARILQRRRGPGDLTRGHMLLEKSRATGQVCGMVQLLGWIDYLGPIEPEGDAPVAQIQPPAGGAPFASVAVLRRDGDVWQVGFAGETFRMKEAKGVHLLAMLLRHPGQEIHALDLAAGAPGAATGGTTVDRGDAGPLLDPAARTAYKSRLEDLRDELEEAERFNDTERAERARQEIDFLADELARGVGLGGRERRAASASERARVNATRTIGAVVKKIAALSPRLGEHLRATVRTGYVCIYAPDPTSPVRWEL